MSDIFMSYASEDRPRGEEFARALEGQGWTVFWDRTIPIGKTWRETIGRELSEARCVIVLWSKTSIDSNWVQEEADDGRRRGVLVPVLIDKVVPPIGFRSVQAADLADWDAKRPTQAFGRLLVDIAALVGSNPRPVPEEARPAPEGPKVEAGKPRVGRAWGRTFAAAGSIFAVFVLLAVWQSWKDSPPAPSVSTPAPQAPAAGSYVAAPAPAAPDAAPSVAAPAAQPAPADSSQAPPNAAPDTGVSLTELALRMKNEPSVTSAVIGATKVLAAADKTPEFFEQGCDKDPQVKDFYRGMLLAHAGYYLVLSELRTGTYKNYGFPPKDYSLLDKASLYAFWTKERISQVWRDFERDRRFERRRQESVGGVPERAAVFSLRLCSREARQARPRLDELGLRAANPERGDQRDLKRAGRAPISKCYESDYGYKLNWNVTANGSSEIAFEPINYMIGFWHRRDVEGKSDLADWFLSTMVTRLKP